MLILPAASVIAALLAVVLYPKLFYPSRYLLALPIFLAIALPVSFALLAPKSRTPIARDVSVVLGTFALLLIFGWKAPQANKGYIKMPDAIAQSVFPRREISTTEISWISFLMP